MLLKTINRGMRLIRKGSVFQTLKNKHKNRNLLHYFLYFIFGTLQNQN